MKRIVSIVGVLVIILTLLFIPSMTQADETPKLLINGAEVSLNADDNYILTGSGTIATVGKVDGSITITVGTWVLTDKLSITGMVEVLGGSFNTASYDIDCEFLYIGLYGNVTPIAVNLGNSTINCFSWAVRGSNVTITEGKSTINTTLMFDDTDKTGRKYYNVNIKDRDGVYGFVEGKSEFNKISFDGKDKSYISHDIKSKEPIVKKGVLATIPVKGKPNNSIKITVNGVETVITK